MTKCTEALIRYIYEEFDVNRIEICMSTDNKKVNQYLNVLDSQKKVL